MSHLKLYTKAGDSGRASTLTRKNIPKDSPVFELLGTLDELESSLGLAKVKAPSVASVIEELQQSLQELSGELAGSKKFADRTRIEQLEKAIDSIMETVPEFSGFILPGQTESGAALDVARTVARRAERCAVTASQTGGITRETLAWLNRLSDLLYALARLCDQSAVKPVSATGQSLLPMAGAGEGLCDKAAILCKAVRQYAARQGVRVVTAVCDAGGNPVALQREDDAFIASVDIAMNKAFTAVSLKMTTEELGRLAKPGQPLYGIQNTNNNRIVIFGGGVPLIRNGAIVGGFGVSGGTAEQDTAFGNFASEYFTKEME